MAQAHQVTVLSAIPFSKLVPLLRETLAREGRLDWRVEGQSMTPTLPPDSLIEIRALDETPHLGDIVVYASDSALVVHRLVARRGTALIFQGDHRRLPDSTVTKAQLIGRVVTATYRETILYPQHFSRLVAYFWVSRYYWLKGLRYLRRKMPKRG